MPHSQHMISSNKPCYRTSKKDSHLRLECEVASRSPSSIRPLRAFIPT